MVDLFVLLPLAPKDGSTSLRLSATSRNETLLRRKALDGRHLHAGLVDLRGAELALQVRLQLRHHARQLRHHLLRSLRL